MGTVKERTGFRGVRDRVCNEVILKGRLLAISLGNISLVNRTLFTERIISVVGVYGILNMYQVLPKCSLCIVSLNPHNNPRKWPLFFCFTHCSIGCCLVIAKALSVKGPADRRCRGKQMCKVVFVIGPVRSL